LENLPSAEQRGAPSPEGEAVADGALRRINE
jgi:hypothetical protein